MNRKIGKIIIFLIIVITIIVSYFTLHRQETNDGNNPSSGAAPSVQNQTEAVKTPKPENKTAENVVEPATKQPAQNIPEKFLLDMPFYSQAPLSKWDAFHEDMCEESSVLNAALFLEGKKLTRNQFEAELQKMQDVEKKKIGEWKSTTVSQVKKFVDIYFDGRIKGKIISNPSIEDIEAEIAAGNPVLAPLAGRDIGNPNFTPPGPVYHMLVIKGYDAHNFITNDVGTRKGDSYAYKKEIIMKNMHDWDEKDIHLGEKMVLALYGQD
ncbi:MAG: C39 family peptidase [Parcubacteria group bacterium]|jgi:hypothetical protein